MQSSQRVQYNHALAFAIEQANRLSQPLIVFFGLTGTYPGSNERHLRFLVEGLSDISGELETLGIPLVIRTGSPVETLTGISRDASVVIVDRGYLRTEAEWYTTAVSKIRCQFIQVESNAVVPVHVASPKEEYAAATFRPKISRMMNRFLEQLVIPPVDVRMHQVPHESRDLSDPDRLIASLDPDRRAGPLKKQGGETRARKHLERFIDHRLEGYPDERNDPALDATSHLSAHLHFGQISPLEIALRVQEAGGTGSEAFLEELIVRRELAINFVTYNPFYDQYACLPAWARSTLEKHRSDPREYLYTPAELEQAKTHDPYWNAAQEQMLTTGYMHGYMRMYWGKKILEWSPTPEDAYSIALILNDRYELDGRDPNSYAGIAWCFGKHDRPWRERPIFGTIRYMNAAGLKRKANPDLYVKRVSEEIGP
jgi:deoxyribodipyrimidine photo-lyase